MKVIVVVKFVCIHARDVSIQIYIVIHLLYVPCYTHLGWSLSLCLYKRSLFYYSNNSCGEKLERLQEQRVGYG